jgi:small conductance mechanosensitive channel
LSAVIFSLFILFIILGIFNLGGTINKILATAGVLGLAIGLALQDPMNNLFSGVFMSVRKLYKIGDMVETNGYFGTIIDIDLRATKLFLPSGQHVVIPNKDVIQNPLINYSTSGARRVEIECGVGYGDRLKDIESVVIGAIAKLHNLNAEKEVDFFFTEFGGSSINFKVRFWLNDTDQKSFLKDQSKGIIAIKEAFDDSGINIPFPITTLDFGNIENLDLQETLARNSEKLNPKSHTPINIKNN